MRCPPGQDCFDQYVILGLEDDGTWKPFDGDDALLEALDALECLNSGVNLRKTLSGRWIEGSPGPPGPDGYNPLDKFWAYHPPLPKASVTLSPTPSTSMVESADTELTDQLIDRRSDCDVSPVLDLKKLGGRGANKVLVARIVGKEGGRFDGVEVGLGRRQLFCLHLLFTSKQVETLEGNLWTVVREDKALDAFGEWVSKRYLKFERNDKDHPERRLAKMWEPLAARLNAEPKLQGLIRHFGKTSKSPKLFAIQLQPSAMQSLLPPIDQLLGGQRQQKGPLDALIAGL